MFDCREVESLVSLSAMCVVVIVTAEALGLVDMRCILDSISFCKYPWNTSSSSRPAWLPTQLSTVRYRGTLDVDVAMLNRDRSIGVLGACELVQLNREAFGGDFVNSLTPCACNSDGTDERRFSETERSSTPGPSIGSTGELEASLARLGCIMVN
jgi:hypothetical protein